MRTEILWTKPDIIELLPTFDVSQAGQLGRSMFNAACSRKLTVQQNIDVLDTIRAGLGYYEVRADGDDEWQKVAADWRRNQHVYELITLTDQLRAVDVFTDEHLEIMMDPQRNTVLNGFGLSLKASAYYDANPGTRRATNYARGTYLFNAGEKCRHAVSSAPGGGVKCSKCPGWFCF